jgi:hypothetical protein
MTYEKLKDLPWERVDAGWERAEVTLAEGERAPNPASTSRPYLYGPATLEYMRSPSGINIRVS